MWGTSGIETSVGVGKGGSENGTLRSGETGLERNVGAGRRVREWGKWESGKSRE